MQRLKNKNAVVTGGNSGIGRAIAKEFADQGAHVTIFGQNQATIDEAVSYIGDGTVGVQGDVTRLSDLENLYEQATEAGEGIDVLVVNAGGGRVAPLDQVTEEIFDSISDETAFFIEASRRIGSRISVEFEARSVNFTNPDGPLYFVRDDSYVQISVTYFY